MADAGNQTTTEYAIAFALGEVKGEVRNLRNDLVGGFGKLDQDNSALETRVTKLEHRQIWIAGVATGVGGTISFIAQWIFS